MSTGWFSHQSIKLLTTKLYNMFNINIWNIVSSIQGNVTTGLEVYLPKILGAVLLIVIWALVSIAVYKFVRYLFKKFKILDWVKRESDFEALYVKVKNKKIEIALFAVYFPPKSTVEHYIEFANFYEHQVVDDNRNVYVTGDFNLPNLASH